MSVDGTLLQDGDRYVLRFERHLSHPVERVWRAVTDASEMAQWFPGQPRIELRVGGEARFAEPGFDVDPDLLPTHGTVTELEPPEVFAFRWGKDLLRFELSAEGDGCMLVFTHTFANRASAPRSAAGWSVCIDSLAALVDGAGESGVAGDSWHDYYVRYRRDLGSKGVLSRQGDSAVLRFERLLEHPAGDAWDALTRPERMSEWLAEATFEPVVGGSIELRLAHPPGYVVTGTVRRIERPKVLEYSWTSPGEPAGTVKWQIIPAGDRCLVLLTHTVDGHWNEAGTLAAWHVHLALLEAALAGRPTWPFPESEWSELHGQYAGADR
jgi:uncharacterized protein YndB with AHSA1/START domain